MAYHSAWSRKIKNDTKYWKQRKLSTGDWFLRSRKSWKTERGWWDSLMISSRGPGGEGFLKPNSQHYLEESETTENESHGRDSDTETALAWIRERGRYALAFPPLCSLWSPVSTSHSPNPSGNQRTQSLGSTDWRGCSTSPAPHPAILSEAWMHLNANEVQHKRHLQIRTHLISKCQMLSNQKYLLTTTTLFLISPSQTIRNRENGYHIFKSIPSNSDYVSVALPAPTSHPLTWRHCSTSCQNSKFERWCA